MNSFVQYTPVCVFVNWRIYLFHHKNKNTIPLRVHKTDNILSAKKNIFTNFGVYSSTPV